MEFTNARGWSQFYDPRNLILGIVGEVGELAELLQWEGDKAVEQDAEGSCGGDTSSLSTAECHQINKLAQEIADVCICVLKLANALNMAEDLESGLAECSS
jgi:dCTP diphosphatase